MKKAITRASSSSSWLSTPGNPLLQWPSPSSSLPPQHQNPNPNPKNPDDLPSAVDSLCRSGSFDSAWSLLLSSLPAPLPAFSVLFRRYSRRNMPTSAIRSFSFLLRNPNSFVSTDDEPPPLDLLLDALCKEGHVKAASAYASSLSLSLRSHNILLHGWLRVRRLDKAQKLFDQMPQRSVVTYGTLIEGLSRARRPNDALSLLEQMRLSNIAPNHATCNPIVDSLSEAGRFKEALALVEKFPLFGISANIYTYNSLIKGFCKNGDLVGASKTIKQMIGREILPTVTTYNYFFKYFSRFGKIEEGMNLYTKMVQSGYSPNRLTYQLLIKMFAESEKLDLAVQMIREMEQSGFESDLATSSMLVHLLVRLRKIDEACKEFEGMIKKGIVPQYVTYRMLTKELRRLGMGEIERKVSELMDSVPHSTKLPGSYREREGDEVVELRKSIMKKARVMSETLKTCKDPKELRKLKGSTESAVESANKLIADIRRRVYKVQSG
ncbi:putative pentatricopeptide repeat-containing protein, mitochondrial [Iris pallida]|uniref:Pentatricopeptide repeat-containing protein, mitochondrial n=1 Tax=Iris pallida TaxID=29817 RepID=A0AAX6HEU2_IRIPA|nr:putative pentatricopeptide repeat-containing protein, mitochondrial [Iris pallida]